MKYAAAVESGGKIGGIISRGSASDGLYGRPMAAILAPGAGFGLEVAFCFRGSQTTVALISPSSDPRPPLSLNGLAS